MEVKRFYKEPLLFTTVRAYGNRSDVLAAALGAKTPAQHLAEIDSVLDNPHFAAIELADGALDALKTHIVALQSRAVDLEAQKQ